MENTQNKDFYDFGAFRLDLRNRLLWLDGKPVALNLKEYEVLLFLVENAGRVVEKRDLLDAVWKDTFVEEGTLTQSISRLRKKLEAGSTDGNIIETLPKRGYRFTPQVTTGGDSEIIIEEQTLTRIRIEETVTSAEMPELPAAAGGLVLDAETGRRGNGASYALQPANQNPKFKTQNSKLFRLAGLLGIVALAAIGFVVYQNFYQKPAPKVIFVSRVVPFSGLPGYETMPAFSPDGKQIAFVWNSGDRDALDVYVKLVGEGEPVRLTKNETASLYPVFSPDGKRIAFSRSFPAASEIYLISALGGAERKIAEVQSGGTSFSFSPDGKTLTVADRDSENSTNGVIFINVETGAKQRLTVAPENSNDNTPRFSPDGKSIVFVRSGAKLDDQDLFVVSAAGGEVPRRLTFDRAKLSGQTWSADGRQIIFSSMRAASSTNLWQIAATGGEPELIKVDGKNPIRPIAAPDGKTIAYVEEFQNTDVWRLEMDSARKQISHPKLIAYIREDESPKISPDGSRIAFGSARTGRYEMWIADQEGKNQRQLTDSPNTPGSPRFSPDGKQVVYDAQTGDTNRDIFVVSVEGGAPRRLTADASRENLPAWSADGEWIYFASNRAGDFNLWKMPAGGGAAVQITKQGAFGSFAAPDGKTIFYSKGRDAPGLWRVSATAGDELPVPELAEADDWRLWTVTQGGIYFVARAEQPPYKIKFYDFTNEQISEIATTANLPLGIHSGLSASSDGKTILYAQRDQNASSIMLAEPGK